MNLRGFLRFMGLAGMVARAETNTAITTAGAGTLTAAALAGGTITRSGPSAAYTDTTATATLIAEALPSPAAVGMSWIVRIRNTVAFAQTVTGGTGVTVSGVAIVPPLSVGEFLVTYTAAGTFTMVGIGSQSLSNLPVASYATAALATGTLTAGQITGAQHVYLETTTDGAASMTTRTAAEMFADTPNAQVGQTYKLTLINSGNNTLTLVAGSNVTLTGTMTVATTTTRTFVCTFNTASTMTIQGVDKGAIEAT